MKNPFSSPAPARGTLVVLALMIAHVLVKVAALPVVLRTPLQGDEVTYDRAAAAIADAIRSLVSGRGLPVAELQDTVIDHGWFMPGTPLLLGPLHLLDPDPSLAAVRLWMGTLTLVGFLGAVWAIRVWAGWGYAAALLVVPGLVPLWVLFSFTIWGDLAAGVALILVVALLMRWWGRIAAGEDVRVRDGLVLGLALAVTLYLRSSALPLVAGVLALVTLAVLALTRGRRLRRSLVGVAVAAATFAALLLPWSVAVSKTFDHRVVTTTTVPISMAYAFGDRDQLCLGPCPAGNPWYAMTHYAAEVERKTGENQLDVQRRMSDYALRGVTPRSYASAVAQNAHRYVLEPTGFALIFRVRGEGVDPAAFTMNPPSAASDAVVTLTNVMYFLTLALGAIGLLAVRRLPARAQVIAILAGLLTAALMLQPFVHVSSPRYWPVFLPMLTLSAAGLFVRSDPEQSNRWLRRIHGAVAAGWVVVVAAVAVLAW